MNNALQAFAFDSHAVRVVTINDAPWFVAKDVAQCLGLAHHRDATRKLDDDEKDGVEIIDAIGRGQQTTVINESGLYAMILRCDGATTPGTPAHTFRKWVTSEVLPSIRKTGSYTAPNAAPMTELTQVLCRVDRLIGVVEKLIESLPAILSAQKPKVRRPPIYEKDLPAILALRQQGARCRTSPAPRASGRPRCITCWKANTPSPPAGASSASPMPATGFPRSFASKPSTNH